MPGCEAEPATFDSCLDSHIIYVKTAVQASFYNSLQVLLNVCLESLEHSWILPYSSTGAPRERKQVIFSHKGYRVIILLSKCCGEAAGVKAARPQGLHTLRNWGQLHRKRGKTQTMPFSFNHSPEGFKSKSTAADQKFHEQADLLAETSLTSAASYIKQINR